VTGPRLRRTVLLPLALALALATASAARAEIVDLAFDGAGRFMHAAPVPPGKFLEVCGKLTKGLAVAWHYDAAQPLNFNIHYHEGKKVVMPEKRDATAAARGTLQVPLDQDYCWMWTNKSGAPVPLTLSLSR
jgi:hypothetical protein